MVKVGQFRFHWRFNKGKKILIFVLHMTYLFSVKVRWDLLLWSVIFQFNSGLCPDSLLTLTSFVCLLEELQSLSRSNCRVFWASRKAIFLLDIWVFLLFLLDWKSWTVQLQERRSQPKPSLGWVGPFILQIRSNWLIPSSLLCKYTNHLSSSLPKEWYARLRRSLSLFFGKVVSLIA